MNDFTIRTGDTWPNLRAQLLDSEGDPIDLSDATVTLTVADAATGAVAIDAVACTPDVGTDGWVEYDWDDGAALNAGLYTFVFGVTIGTEVFTVPNDGFKTLLVEPLISTGMLAGATFDPALPTLKDHIRLALGDRHSETTAGIVAEPLLVDALINAKLAANGYLETLAQLAESLAAQFAHQPDEYSESTGVRLSWRGRIAAWQKLAQDARSGLIIDPIPVSVESGISSTTIDYGRTFTETKRDTSGNLIGDVGSMEVW